MFRAVFFRLSRRQFKNHSSVLQARITGAHMLKSDWRTAGLVTTMPDLLVNLLKLPELQSHTQRLAARAITIRRAEAFEISPVREFVTKSFSVGWADEISVGFGHKPVTVFIATRERRVIGFAGYECTRKAFFGPTGVATDERGFGVGKALLIASLCGLRELGYVYGIIGAAGPVEFYQEAVGAIVIPDSVPGIYTDLLQQLP